MRVASMKMQDHSVLQVDNIGSGETVHQRCLLVQGRSSSFEEYGDHVSVTVTDGFGSKSTATTWPMSQGYFKAVVLLSPGQNEIHLQQFHSSVAKGQLSLEVTYVPLLQLPPLHLAIMIAQDSPLMMDCPPYKAGGLSSTHSSLDAAIAKFRTTAYMWQALTAEQMRAAGLGRRSFRLDEEWAVDTTSRTAHTSFQDASKALGTTAKIHLIRSDKTVAEIRDANVAQQNERGRKRDDLHKYFEAALKAHGGIFASTNRPVVAGMILDSQFSMEQDLVVGHAALGCHNPKGLSLGMFGSHLTYSWPRFLEEIPSCLTDTTPPGDTVCNDNGECETSWEACSIGQGAFLHEVGHAFGASHSSGIMTRGYAQNWPRNFVSQTAYCAKSKSFGVTVTPEREAHEARWCYKDMLSFKCFPHFRLPGDSVFSAQLVAAMPTIKPLVNEDETDSITIQCKAGIALVGFYGDQRPLDIVPLEVLQQSDKTTLTISVEGFDRSSPLPLTVLGLNGKEAKIANVWKLVAKKGFIRIPNSDIVLKKQYASSSQSDETDPDNQKDHHQWAVLLTEKGRDGEMKRANMIDIHIGAIFDSVIVRYEDGHEMPCAHPVGRYQHRSNFHMGGNSYKGDLLPDDEITEVAINCAGSWGDHLAGCRMTLSSGETYGDLRHYRGRDQESYSDDDEEDNMSDGEEDGSNGNRIKVLKPDDGEKIIGFFGQSSPGSNWCTGFGIITAPRDVELPAQVYDMAELQNVAK